MNSSLYSIASDHKKRTDLIQDQFDIRYSSQDRNIYFYFVLFLLFNLLAPAKETALAPIKDIHN